MGYETTFILEADFSKVPSEQLELTQLKVEKALYANDYQIRLSESFSGKWYDHHDDMLKISSQFPEVLFMLEGNGEENDDIWESEYLNGKHRIRHVELSFPEWGVFE